MHLAPGHLGLQFDDRLCSCVTGFADACPGHSGEERGEVVNRPPPGGELALVVGELALTRIVRVCWEHLAEAPVRRSFNAHLCQPFSLKKESYPRPFWPVGILRQQRTTDRPSSVRL